LPSLSIVTRVAGVIVPFVVVLKLRLVPCAVSDQVSVAVTNMPPRVPLKPFVAPAKYPRPRKPARLSPARTARGAADVPRALLPTNKEAAPLLANVLLVIWPKVVPDVALLTSRFDTGKDVPMPTIP